MRFMSSDKNDFLDKEQDLFDLSFDLLREIFLKWLEENDIAQLDKAICNHKQRAKYLSIISSDDLVFAYPYHGNQNSIVYFNWLLHRNIHIESLVLPYNFSYKFELQYLDCMYQTLKHVKYLDCSKYIELNDDLFQLIIYHSKNIRKIDIGSNAAISSISNESLSFISNISTKLMKLKFVQNMFITDIGIDIIVKQCKLLRNIQFHACLNIGDPSIDSITNHCIELEKFSLSCNYTLTMKNYYNINNNYQVISSRSITNMYLKCKYLKRLSIVNCDATISLNTVNDLSKEQDQMIINDMDRNILELQLSRNNILSDIFLINIFIDINRLLLLDLQDNKTITDISLIHIAPQLKSLKSLNISYCYQITSLSMIELIKYCKDLEYLSLQACNVTDEVILHISLNTLKIINLNISWCVLVTELSLLHLSNGFLNHLNNLILSGCGRITKQSIKLILQHLSSLKNININYCRMIYFEDVSIWKKDFPQVDIVYHLQ